MKTINETIPVKIRAEFWLIFKNWAIGIKGPIPICIIFLTISLLSSLKILKINDIKNIDNSARTIRLPIHISEKLSKMRRVSRELSHKFGRQPTRLEMATEMGIDQKDLEDLISQSAPCASLDAHARGEEDRSTLGELIPDPNCEEPMEGMDRTIQKEHLGTWLSQLNEREQKIMKLRFGLDGEEPLTLAEIGRQINVSRERVRQLEAKAILKLRVMTTHQKAA